MQHDVIAVQYEQCCTIVELSTVSGKFAVDIIINAIFAGTITQRKYSQRKVTLYLAVDSLWTFAVASS